jgi:type VI protein secretion system component VasK
VSGADLAGLALGGLLVAAVLGVLVWSEFGNRHAEATIRRTVDQDQRTRSGRW